MIYVGRIMAELCQNKGSPRVEINLERGLSPRNVMAACPIDTIRTVKCHRRNVVINMSVSREGM